jgi:VIT1/CCC1 family predicted Fe2+/Mn2+ transporter
MNKKIAPLIEYVTESTTACLVMMVHGNVLALTTGHLLIASQTGVIAGAIATVSIFVARASKRWIISLVLGVATGIVDFFVHPGMFGTVATEAVITGLGAAILSYLVGTAIRYFRAKSKTAK